MPDYVPKIKAMGHEVEWTLGATQCTVTDSVSQLDDEPEFEMASLEDLQNNQKPMQEGVGTKGVSITLMVTKEGEATDPVAVALAEAAADNKTKRVGPLTISKPAALATTIPVCKVKRTAYTTPRNAAMTVTYEIKASTGTVNVTPGTTTP